MLSYFSNSIWEYFVFKKAFFRTSSFTELSNLSSVVLYHLLMFIFPFPFLLFLLSCNLSNYNVVTMAYYHILCNIILLMSPDVMTVTSDVILLNQQFITHYKKIMTLFT